MKSLTIGKKLYVSFGIMIVLIILLSGGGVWQLKGLTHTFGELIESYQPIGQEAEKIQTTLLTIRRHEKDFIARQDPKYLEKMDKSVATLHHQAQDLAAKADTLGLAEIVAESKKIEADLKIYENGFGNIVKLIQAQGDKDTGIRGAMRKEAHGMETAIKTIGSDALMVHYLMMRRHEKDFILREDEKYVKKSQGVLDKIEAGMDDSLLAGAEGKNLLKHSKGYVGQFSQLAQNIIGIKQEYPKMREAAHNIETLAKHIVKEIHDVVATKEAYADKQASATILFVYIFCASVTAIAIFLVIFAVRSITKPISRVIEGLNAGADQVAAASGQVSSSSQSLAEGSSEQAASIEETSSSLEEMSAMTNQNADNARQADNLMKEANQVVKQANDSMSELTHSMDEISKASEETSKIIKTIDEIAFQTNLLALNAAVEAARAGEAGAGFAVVADEVRNLAMRAADAAKTTAELIETTVKKTGDGTALVTKTNEAFGEVAESAGKVGELVGEIAAASSEQSQGIGQVNGAVTEMDKVVQQNAANAEESASAAEEMNAQAEQMKSLVNDLVDLVGDISYDKQAKRVAIGDPDAFESPKKGQDFKQPNNIKALAAPTMASAAPETVIPMDDDKFEDF